LLRAEKLKTEGAAAALDGSPSCYLAQLSSNGIERLPDRSVMEIKLDATARALKGRVAANPPRRRAPLVAATRTADDFYGAGIE
jgi:hypothetical protein